MLRQYRLCLFLIGFSMAAMDAVAVEFKRLDLKAPYELFYENAVINGQIGQSLVVTNNSGDVEIVDTRNGSVSATFELSAQQQVVNVKSSPGSSAGLITIRRTIDNTNYYRSFVFVEGLKNINEGNNLKAQIKGLYPDTEQGRADREKDYINVIGTNKSGDLLAQSDVAGKTILVERAYEGQINAAKKGGELSAQYKSGATSVFANGHSSPVLCFDDAGMQFIQVFKLENGNVDKFGIFQLKDNKLEATKMFSLPAQARAVSVQCFGGVDKPFHVVVEANLIRQIEVSDVPVRSIVTSGDTFQRVQTTELKTNTIRILYDGTSEVTVAGNFAYHPDSGNLINTPVADGIYIEVSQLEDKSFLSTFDYKLAINLPGVPVSMIEYPTRSVNERLYCVFGQQEKDIYKSCYTSSL